MTIDERNAVRILHKMIDFIIVSSHDPKKIGALTKRLSDKDREALKALKAENIQDRILTQTPD